MEKFEQVIGLVIAHILGARYSSYGYQYSEIIHSLMAFYFSGGNYMEDISNHLLPHLRLHPSLRTCSSDTILRTIKELTTDNITYTSDSGKNYDFNAAEKANSLLLDTLLSTGQLDAETGYDLDFDHEFFETEKYDATRTYKHFFGYSPGVAVVGDLVVCIENRDGNANVRFHQQDILERFFTRLEDCHIHIKRGVMDIW